MTGRDQQAGKLEGPFEAAQTSAARHGTRDGDMTRQSPACPFDIFAELVTIH